MAALYNTDVACSDKSAYFSRVCEESIREKGSILNLSDYFPESILLVKAREEEPVEGMVLFKTDQKGSLNNPKIDTRTFQEREELNRKWTDGYRLFQHIFGKKRNIFPESLHGLIEQEFKMAMWEVLQFRPDRFGIDISIDESVYIYSEFGKKYISLDLFFEENGEVDGLICLMEGNEAILSYNGSVPACMDKIKTILQPCR